MSRVVIPKLILDEIKYTGKEAYDGMARGVLFGGCDNKRIKISGIYNFPPHKPKRGFFNSLWDDILVTSGLFGYVCSSIYNRKNATRQGEQPVELTFCTYPFGTNMLEAAIERQTKERPENPSQVGKFYYSVPSGKALVLDSDSNRLDLEIVE